ncbi:Uncharacterised protein [Kluyvera cryocrescens]|uniref:Uncharacterized protein n=1 Tax=Kluyvera cryocrescens TaxID=580 RepID=A0A485BA52_KLUCR|nr:Uncharacterised protein [Kluyvera cryocrescens]
MPACRCSLKEILQETLTRHRVRLTDAGERFSVPVWRGWWPRRVSEGFPLADFHAPKMWRKNVSLMSRIDVAAALQKLAGKPVLPRRKEEWLCVHIAARQVQDVDPETISADGRRSAGELHPALYQSAI